MLSLQGRIRGESQVYLPEWTITSSIHLNCVIISFPLCISFFFKFFLSLLHRNSLCFLCVSPPSFFPPVALCSLSKPLGWSNNICCIPCGWGIFMSLKMPWTMWTLKWEPNTFALPTPCGSVVWVRKGIHVFPWSRGGSQKEFAVEFSGVNKTACICNSTSAWQDTLHSCVYRYSPALRQA